MALEMRSVYSSFVARIGYDPDASELVVEYQKGDRKTAYFGVPPRVADEVMNAPSIGEALHRQIRGRYASRDG